MLLPAGRECNRRPPKVVFAGDRSPDTMQHGDAEHHPGSMRVQEVRILMAGFSETPTFPDMVTKEAGLPRRPPSGEDSVAAGIA
jgi:hypothetical protein